MDHLLRDESASKNTTLRQNCSVLADFLRFHRSQANAPYWHQKSPVDKILFYVDYRRKLQHGERPLKLSSSFTVLKVLAKHYRRHVLMGWIVGSPGDEERLRRATKTTKTAQSANAKATKKAPPITQEHYSLLRERTREPALVWKFMMAMELRPVNLCYLANQGIKVTPGVGPGGLDEKEAYWTNFGKTRKPHYDLLYCTPEEVVTLREMMQEAEMQRDEMTDSWVKGEAGAEASCPLFRTSGQINRLLRKILPEGSPGGNPYTSYSFRNAGAQHLAYVQKFNQACRAMKMGHANEDQTKEYETLKLVARNLKVAEMAEEMLLWDKP